LKLSPGVSGLVLSLSVSSFKLDVIISSTAGLFFLARLHGLDLSSGQIILFLGGAALFSFAAPGIPTGGLPHSIPLYL